MCFGGLLTFLKSNLRSGGLESGRRWECEMSMRTGCSFVESIEFCMGGGPSIIFAVERMVPRALKRSQK